MFNLGWSQRPNLQIEIDMERYTLYQKIIIENLLMDLLPHMVPDEEGDWYHDDGCLPLLLLSREEFEELQKLFE